MGSLRRDELHLSGARRLARLTGGVTPLRVARVMTGGIRLLALIGLVILVLCRRMFRSAGRTRQALSAT